MQHFIDQLDVNVVVACVTAIIVMVLAVYYRDPSRISAGVKKLEDNAETMATLEKSYNASDETVKSVIEMAEKLMYFLYHSTPAANSPVSGFKEPLKDVAEFLDEVSDGVPVADKKVTAVMTDEGVTFK